MYPKTEAGEHTLGRYTQAYGSSSKTANYLCPKRHRKRQPGNGYDAAFGNLGNDITYTKQTPQQVTGRPKRGLEPLTIMHDSC